MQITAPHSRQAHRRVCIHAYVADTWHSAYVSWACGKVAEVVEPDLVALHTSRGHETLSSKVCSHRHNPCRR